MKKFITACLTVLCLSLFTAISTPKAACADTQITVNLSNPAPGIQGFYIYYDTDGSEPFVGTGATEGDSPIQLADPNATSFTLTGLPHDTYYVCVSSYNEVGEGIKSSVVRYRTIDSITTNTDPGDYTTSDTINVTLGFETMTFLNNGNLIVTLNSGGYLTVSTIDWVNSITTPYVVQVGESTYPDPLRVTSVYLDPNDPGNDVALYDSGGNICTNISDIVNLNSDPNSLIYVVITPDPPSIGINCN